MDLLTIDEIIQIAPNSDKAVEQYGPFLDAALRRWGITGKSSIGAFVANVAEESAHFKRTLEYADGSAYEGRKDLGNIINGDGRKFRGRGLIQITGRSAYNQCSRDMFGDMRLLNNPELLQTPENALNSACWFWSHYKGIDSFCDEADELFIHPGAHQYTKIQWIRILVNGGLNGFDEVAANYARARKVLNF